MVPLHGSSEATHLSNGKIQARYYGFTASVRNSPARFLSHDLITICLKFDSGSGEEYHMVNTVQLFSYSIHSNYQSALASFKTWKTYVLLDWP